MNADTHETDLDRYRPRLFAVAYRMLGDVHDAEDTVQESFLRWHRAPRGEVIRPEAWLVSVVTRLGRLRTGRDLHQRWRREGSSGAPGDPRSRAHRAPPPRHRSEARPALHLPGRPAQREPAPVQYLGARVFSANFIGSDGQRITAMYRVMNPDKLGDVWWGLRRMHGARGEERRGKQPCTTR